QLAAQGRVVAALFQELLVELQRRLQELNPEPAQARRLEPVVLADCGQVVVDRGPRLGEMLLRLLQRPLRTFAALVGVLLRPFPPFCPAPAPGPSGFVPPPSPRRGSPSPGPPSRSLPPGGPSPPAPRK